MHWLKALFITNNKHFNIFYALLFIAMVSLPITNWLMLPIAILMLLNWIIEWNWKEKWQHVKQQEAVPAFFCFLAICLHPIIGFFLSSNKAGAMSSFDCSLWFLIAPLVILSYHPEQLTRKRINAVFWGFSIGVLAHILIIFGIAIKKYIATGNSIYFYYTTLSILKHPSYVALYIIAAFMFVIDELRKKWKTISNWGRLGLLATLCLYAMAVVLLQSKAGLISFLIVLFIWFVVYFFTNKRRIIPGVIILFAAIGAMLFVYQAGWIEKNRISETLEQIENHKDNPYGRNSSEVRLTLWHSSLEVIQKNMPLGVGTGDAGDALRLNSLTRNYRNVIGGHYNAHCQYLQALLETGVIGLLLLLTYCFFPLVEGVRKRFLPLCTLALIVILNIAVECMFNVRSGVDFIAIFFVLFFLCCRRDETAISC